MKIQYKNKECTVRTNEYEESTEDWTWQVARQRLTMGATPHCHIIAAKTPHCTRQNELENGAYFCLK